MNANKNKEIEQGKRSKNVRNVFSVFVKKEDKKKETETYIECGKQKNHENEHKQAARK